MGVRLTVDMDLILGFLFGCKLLSLQSYTKHSLSQVKKRREPSSSISIFPYGIEPYCRLTINQTIKWFIPRFSRLGNFGNRVNCCPVYTLRTIVQNQLVIGGEANTPSHVQAHIRTEYGKPKQRMMMGFGIDDRWRRPTSI